MDIGKRNCSLKRSINIASLQLERNVQVDLYIPVHAFSQPVSLLLINDGQDLDALGLQEMLETMYEKNDIRPLLCAGIHAGPERKQEYGTAGIPDYKKRGSKAQQYTRFILEELIPFIRTHYMAQGFEEKAFAGFSLGALSAMDIVWNHPHEFSKVGVFSGSLWWRTKDKHDPTYSDASDRIMHREVRNGAYYPWLKFFFECGAADEEEDRNANGVIDSIDDTLDLIRELAAKGYNADKDIRYLQIDDGRHDVETWARAMPEFLQWGWGK